MLKCTPNHNCSQHIGQLNPYQFFYCRFCNHQNSKTKQLHFSNPKTDTDPIVNIDVEDLKTLPHQIFNSKIDAIPNNDIILRRITIWGASKCNPNCKFNSEGCKSSLTFLMEGSSHSYHQALHCFADLGTRREEIRAH